jgi:hypothetical protein
MEQTHALPSLTDNLSYKLIKKLEDYIIEGLKRKGFEFENRVQLENFIKSKCTCEDIVSLKQRTYFVNGIPFFRHFYKTKIDFNTNMSDNGGIEISVNYGSFTYL